MNRRDLPRLATLVLEQFTSPLYRESLVGDLAEEWSDGRSPLWLYRQVVLAVARHSLDIARQHALWAITAVCIGWGTLLLLSLVTATAPVSGWIPQFGVGPQTIMALVAPREVGTWWVRHLILFRGFSWLAYLIAQCLAAAGSGWVVRRVFAHDGGVMLLLFLSSFLLLSLPEGYRLTTDAFTHTRFVPYLSAYAGTVLVCGVGIIFGGLRASHPR
jgi:hypothetical protein